MRVFVLEHYKLQAFPLFQLCALNCESTLASFSSGMQWFIVLPLELVAASIVINYWDPNNLITPGVWIIVFLVLIAIINLFGVATINTSSALRLSRP